MSNFYSIITFHGTSDTHAEDLVKGQVDTSIGGGELGQGFYLGTELHVAKAWAKQRHNSEAVVQFHFNDKDFWSFDIECLTAIKANQHRSAIKHSGMTRTFLFYKDVVWSPIVGGPSVYCDQHKWESKKGETFLNGNGVIRQKR